VKDILSKVPGWKIDGRFWVRESDGLRLPVVAGDTSANTVMTAYWAFGDDDGSQTTHTQDTQSTARTAQSGDVNFIIRLQARETAGKTDPWAFQLYADKNSSGTFTEVTSSRTDGLIKSANGSSRTDGEAITSSRLTNPGGTWLDGEFDDGSSAEGTSTIGLSGQYTEIEFCIQIDSANAVNGDYWDLRLESTSGTDLDSPYPSPYPRVTASLALQPINIYPAAVAAGADSVAPTTRLGSISLSPTLVAAGADSVDPTVSVSIPDMDITPSAVATGADSVGPTTRQGSLNLSPTLVSSSAVGVAPSVTLGSISLSPTLVDASAVGVDPTVTISSPPITPSPAVAGADSVNPTVDISSGDVNVYPSAVISSASSSVGEVRQGSQSVSPSLVDASAVGIDPTVYISSGDINVYPSAGSAGADSFLAETRQSSLSLSTSAGSASADSTGPSLGFSSVSVTPGPAIAGADSLGPSVQTGGNLNIYPASISAGTDTSYSIQFGSINISPALSSISTVSSIGETALGSINLTSSSAAAGSDSLIGSVSVSIPPLYVSPSPASAGADSIPPSFFWSSQSASPSESFTRTGAPLGFVSVGEAFSIDPVTAGTAALVEVSGGNNRVYVSFIRFLAPIGPNLQVFPNPAASVADVTGPSLYFTSDSASPDPVTAATSTDGPTITTGDVNVHPSAVTAAVTGSDPDVKQSSHTVYGGIARASTSRVNPSVVYGSISITPYPRLAGTDAIPPHVSDLTVPTPPSTASADSVGPSEVRLGNFSRTPAPSSAHTTVQGPSLHWGSQTATPGASSAVPETIGPQVRFGSISVPTSAASAATTTVSPDVGLSSVSVDVAYPAIARTSSRVGTVIEGGGYLYVYPVESYAQGVTNIGRVRVSGYFAVIPDPATAGTRIHPVHVQITGGSIEVYPVEVEAETSSRVGAVHTGDLDLYPVLVTIKTGSSIVEVRQSSLWRYPDERAVRALGVDPGVILGSISISPSPADAGTRTLHQWTRQSSIIIGPVASVASVASVAPTILFQGGYTAVTPSSAISVVSSTNPQIIYGAALVTPQPARAATRCGIGLILQFSSVDIYPNAGEAIAFTVGPRVQQLAMNLYPVLVSAGTDTTGPSVQMGDYVLYPKFVFTRGYRNGPTVQLGSIGITPTPAGMGTGVDSSMSLSGLSVTTGAAVAIVGSVLGEYLVLDNLYPNLDLAVGAWTDEGGSTEDLFDSLDERPVPSDLDYIMNETPEGEIYRADFTEGADPGRDDHHIVEYRIKKDHPVTRIDITVTLKDGDTTIASWTHQDISTEYVTITQYLTTGQAALITDYSNLRLEFDATEV